MLSLINSIRTPVDSDAPTRGVYEEFIRASDLHLSYQKVTSLWSHLSFGEEYFNERSPDFTLFLLLGYINVDAVQSMIQTYIAAAAEIDPENHWLSEEERRIQEGLYWNNFLEWFWCATQLSLSDEWSEHLRLDGNDWMKLDPEFGAFTFRTSYFSTEKRVVSFEFFREIKECLFLRNPFPHGWHVERTTWIENLIVLNEEFNEAERNRYTELLGRYKLHSDALFHPDDGFLTFWNDVLIKVLEDRHAWWQTRIDQSSSTQVPFLIPLGNHTEWVFDMDVCEYELAGVDGNWSQNDLKYRTLDPRTDSNLSASQISASSPARPSRLLTKIL